MPKPKVRRLVRHAATHAHALAFLDVAAILIAGVRWNELAKIEVTEDEQKFLDVCRELAFLPIDPKPRDGVLLNRLHRVVVASDRHGDKDAAHVKMVHLVADASEQLKRMPAVVTGIGVIRAFVMNAMREVDPKLGYWLPPARTDKHQAIDVRYSKLRTLLLSVSQYPKGNRAKGERPRMSAARVAAELLRASNSLDHSNGRTIDQVRDLVEKSLRRTRVR